MNRLDVIWCVLRSECPPDVASRFVTRLEEFVPAGAPVKFGDVEPLSNQVGDVGVDGFCEAWTSSSEMLFWSAKKPFSGGSTVRLGGLGEDSDAKVGTVSLSVSSDVVADEAERSAFREFFTSVATDIGAFFASVGVARGASWRGSSLEAKLTNPGVTFGKEFHGLPIGDIWCAYFGPRYLPLVTDHLPLRELGEGGFFEVEGAWDGDERKPEARLVGQVPDELLLCTKDLRRRLTRDDLRQGAGLVPAEVIPDGLGG